MTKPNTPPPPPPSDAPPAAPPPNSEKKTAEVDLAAGTSVATGKGADALGDQVHPSTQLREDDGNRSLAHPVTDPGPVAHEGRIMVAHPDRTKGEHRYGDSNDPQTVTMRTSTGHDDGYGKPSGEMVEEVELPPDVFAGGAASDIYNKEGKDNKSLTEQAVKNTTTARDPAPLRE